MIWKFGILTFIRKNLKLNIRNKLQRQIPQKITVTKSVPD